MSARAEEMACEVRSGAGGVDSQEWAAMMLRMYQRWAERRGFDVVMGEVVAGEHAGIASASFIVRGPSAYLLSSEKGVHRLVRISPFDAQSRRHTAFASFDAAPRTAPLGFSPSGEQIRSYILAPYLLVKDLRTGYETDDVLAVLDGDLDGFMESAQ